MDSSRFRTLAHNWEVFGRRDPLFGVLSDPTKQHGRWDIDEFFTSGQAHVSKLFQILDERGVAVAPGRALDFGCGVGRLTLPIAERFDHTVGVDVARSMIQLARKHNRHRGRCDYVVNAKPHLRRFSDGTFDFVHSCLVLQHIPPETSVKYLHEFLRIARPGGVVVFQIPAQTFTDEEVDKRLALPSEGYRAGIQLLDVPRSLEARETRTVAVRVTNRSPVVWSGDIHGGRHICVANHWLDANGDVVVPDDGRMRLTADLAPGQMIELDLWITAPSEPGEYVLDVDLVQEHICWFAQRGSTTGRAPVDVRARVYQENTPASVAPAASASPVRPGVLARLREVLTGRPPSFEMHVVPRADVERAVTSARGDVLHVIEDTASGARWLSYTYVCRKT